MSFLFLFDHSTPATRWRKFKICLGVLVEYTINWSYSESRIPPVAKSRCNLDKEGRPHWSPGWKRKPDTGRIRRSRLITPQRIERRLSRNVDWHSSVNDNYIWAPAPTTTRSSLRRIFSPILVDWSPFLWTNSLSQAIPFTYHRTSTGPVDNSWFRLLIQLVTHQFSIGQSTLRLFGAQEKPKDIKLRSNLP